MRKLELKIPPVVVLFLTMLLAWQIARSHLLPLGTNVFVLGVCLIAAGLVVILLGVLSFRQHRTTVDPRTPEKASQLVQSGIFKYTRNPMYLGMVLMQIGVVALLQEGFAFTSVPVLIAYLQKFQIRPEERQMRRLFGQAYTQYCQRTRRWL